KARYAVFDETIHAAAVARLTLESKLRRALERGELLLHYQPIVSLKTRKIEGFEALARWNCDGRLRLPTEFIPIAEDTGLIFAIGAWAFRQACRQLAAWLTAFPAARGLSMGVNVARKQLADSQFMSLVDRTLR